MDDRLTRLMPGGQRIFAYPSATCPRIIFGGRDAGERLASSRLAQSSTLAGRVRRAAWAAGAWLGVGGFDIGQQPWALKGALGDVAEAAVSAVLFVGPAGPTQKVVVRLQDTAAQPVVFVKLGLRPSAAERVRREGAALRRLPEGLGPAVLGEGVIDGEPYIAIEPVQGRWAPRSVAPSRPVEELFRRMAVGDSDDLRCKGVWAEVSEEPALAAELLPVLGERAWPGVIQHGDAAPWNCLIDSAGVARLIDWEYARFDSLPALDVAYWAMQVSYFVRHSDPAGAARAAVGVVQRVHEDLADAPTARALVRVASYLAWKQEMADGRDAEDRLARWRQEIWRGAEG